MILNNTVIIRSALFTFTMFHFELTSNSCSDSVGPWTATLRWMDYKVDVHYAVYTYGRRHTENCRLFDSITQISPFGDSVNVDGSFFYSSGKFRCIPKVRIRFSLEELGRISYSFQY
jgi:hypothetical protein